ncbi:MAG TPA: RNA-binding protein [Candidatus Melainabacteria bacterium]|jgi:cold-inducible RNA-binding protein|nr:RNA-binding protein [Candidatus Melainabacteria bacterium]HIN64789.1 RNA-binding protein [Candidatus Obscuribacterales bacterium]
MQNNKIFVRNLAFSTTDGELSGIFASCGEVVSAKMATDRDTGRSRGFGFVQMNTQEEAQNAILNLDNSQHNGRTLYVAISESRERKQNTTYGNSW